MGLEAIIAQRIAAAAAQRARLEASNFGLQPLQEGLDSVIQQRQFSAQYGLQKAQYDANQAPLPDAVAGMAAEGLTPDTPSVPSVVGSPALVAGLNAKRAASVATLKNALGSQSASKALAMIAMLDTIHQRKQAMALANLKLSADLADGVLGKPPAAPKGPDAEDTATAEWLKNYGHLPTDKLPPEAWQNLPPKLAVSLLKERGVGKRFTDTMAFNKQKWDATYANLRASAARADAAFAAGRDDEGRQIRRAASASADQAVQEFLQEHNGMLKKQTVMTQNPTTGAWEDTETTVIDTSILPDDAKQTYENLIKTRASLRQQVIGEKAPVVPGTPAPQVTVAPPDLQPGVKVMGETAAPIGTPKRFEVQDTKKARVRELLNKGDLRTPDEDREFLSLTEK